MASHVAPTPLTKKEEFIAAAMKFMNAWDDEQEAENQDGGIPPPKEVLSQLTETCVEWQDKTDAAFAALDVPVYGVRKGGRMLFITFDHRDVDHFFDMAKKHGAVHDFEEERVDVSTYPVRRRDLIKMRNHGAMTDAWHDALAPYKEKNKENK